MPVTIKNRFTDAIILELTVDNLYGANLYGANLSGANLSFEPLPLRQSPIIVDGFRFRVIIWDTHAQIGCQCRSFAAWRDETDFEHAEQFAPFRDVFLALVKAAGREIPA